MVSNSAFISTQKAQNGIEKLCFVIKAKKHFFCERKKTLRSTSTIFPQLFSSVIELNNYHA